MKKMLFPLFLYLTYTICSAETATKYELPKPLKIYYQKPNELLCWLYSSHAILDYYGQVTGTTGLVPSLDDTHYYGNGGVNKDLYLWGIYDSHTFQDILCDLGGIYSIPVSGDISHSDMESEISAKRPVVIVFKYEGSDVKHIVTVYGVATSATGNQFVSYVDPLLKSGKTTALREHILKTDGKDWSNTILLKNSPGVNCTCSEKPEKLIRELVDANDVKGGYDCETTWCPSGKVKITKADGTCDCITPNFDCNISGQPIYSANGAEIKINLLEVFKKLVQNDPKVHITQYDPLDGCAKLIERYDPALFVSYKLAIKFEWGDGNTSTRFDLATQTPTYIYKQSGTYNVVVKVAKFYWNKDKYWTGYSFNVNVTTNDDSRKAAIVRAWKFITPLENKLVSNNGKKFYIGKKEITQKDYVSVMHRVPFYFWGENNFDRPAENVTFYDAIIYCNRRSNFEELTPVYNWTGPVQFNINGNCTSLGNVTADLNKNGYRLPTLDEWQAAFGDPITNYGNYSWYYDNSGNTTHPVGEKTPNKFGLFDMAGNVSEWVWKDNQNAYYSTGGSYTNQTTGLSGNISDPSVIGMGAAHGTVGFRVVRKYTDISAIINLLLD
jgi:formylglycine-generating enzyme required for sulfatase activity